MATLTGQRSHRPRGHLRLVPPLDAPVRTPVDVVADPEPGPRDAAELVARFSRLLPEESDCAGVFSFGGYTQPPA